MPRKAKLLQISEKANSNHNLKKFEAIENDYIALYADGYNEEFIFRKLTEKYFLSESYLRSKLKLNTIRKKGYNVLVGRLKALKNGTYIETQTAPMNGVEYR